MTLVVARSTEVNQLASGIGQVFRHVLEHQYSNEYCHPHTGVLLKGPGDRRLKLFWIQGMVLQDGSAQKFTFSNKQDQGSRICMHCKNIFISRRQNAEGDVSDSKLVQYLKHRDLDIATDQEILDSWMRMRERRPSLNQQQWKQWQSAAGIDFDDSALLMSDILRTQEIIKPISGYCHDFMHGLCSNGVMNWIVYVLLQALFEEGLQNIWETLHGFLQLWVHPAFQSHCKVHKLFESKMVESHRKAEKIKCTASEMLGLYRLLEVYIHTCVLKHDFCTLQCQCYINWCKVLDYCISIPSLDQPNHMRLQLLVEHALQSFVSAGWGEHMKPKYHWALHYSDALKQFSQLPACWSLERKHKSVRKFGNNICNTAQYEKSMMTEVIAEHMFVLESDYEVFKAGSFLVEPRRPTKKLLAFLQQHMLILDGEEVWCSQSCRLTSQAVVTVKDVVFFHDPNDMDQEGSFGSKCGKVHSLMQLSGVKLALIEEYLFSEQSASSRCTKWHVPKEQKLSWAQIDSLQSPLVYTMSSDGKATCLTPSYMWAQSQEKKISNHLKEGDVCTICSAVLKLQIFLADAGLEICLKAICFCK